MNEQEIFLTALEKTASDERRTWLTEACGDNQRLMQRIESLLSRHENAGDFLEEPPPALDPQNTLAIGAGDTREDASEEFPRIALDFLAPSSEPGCLGRIGAYEVLSVLGRGGMGIVLKARDTRLNRLVAVKVLAPELAANSTARKRFIREGQAAAGVVHPNVVTIYGVDEDKLPFLVMEYVDGFSLREKIEQDGPLPLAEIVNIGSQVASGLAVAHRRGLIHRDIKPANILLSVGWDKAAPAAAGPPDSTLTGGGPALAPLAGPTLHAKLTDFGLARAADDLEITQTGEIAGTPQYMSPEQARGETLDVRSDLFSLGSVLYSMCTGRSPFRASNAGAVIHRLCFAAPEPISDVNPTIPDWLSDLIHRLLEKNPADRIQTAQEVADLLVGQASGLPSNSFRGSTLGTQHPEGPPSATREATPALRPNPKSKIPNLKFLATALAGFLFAAAGVWVIIKNKQGQETARIEVPDGGSVTVEAESRSKPDIKGSSSPHSAITSLPRTPQVAAPTGPPPPLAKAPFTSIQAKAHQEAWSSHLGVAVETANSIGIRLVLIPPGEFLMGSTDEQVEEVRKLAQMRNPRLDLKNALERSRPQHRVVISRPFLLGATEVTRGQFREFVEATNHPAPAWSEFETPDRTAGDLDLRDATAFCAWLSKKEGATYRLPTEAEWEYACRAGTTTKYFFGDDDWQCGKYAMASPNGPALAGTLLPNPWGLYDMTGNLSEWLQDGWDPNWYRDSPTVDPVCPVSSEVVYRIGCFQPTTLWLQSLSAYRAHGSPRYRDPLRGFRVVRELDSKPLMVAETVTPAERGVFVLLAAPGAAERKFDTLSEAVQRSSDGDTIEIRGNGPFTTEAIDLQNKPLTIRAASGFRPALHLHGTGTTATKALQERPRDSGPPLITTRASLVLEGLELGEKATASNWIFDSFGPLRVANCRLLWHGHACVRLRGRLSSFRNCELLSDYGGSQFLAPANITVENCLVGQSLHLHSGGAVTDPWTVRIARCTFAGCERVGIDISSIHLNLPRASRLAEKRSGPAVSIKASENVFSTSYL